MKHPLFILALTTCTVWGAQPAGAAMPPPLPKAASTFAAGSMRVDVYGTAGKPALVFIPGLTCGPWEWSGEIAEFAPNYTIYALTLPGFDGLPAARPPLYPKVTADFWTMLAAHGISKPVLIGHSLGGTLAIMLAEQHPELLRGVVAVDGLPVFPGMQSNSPAQRAAAAAQMRAAIERASTPAQFETLEKTYALPFMITSTSDVDAVAPLAARSDPHAVADWFQEDFMVDLRPGLKQISIPLLEIAPFDPKLDPREPGGSATAQAKQAVYQSLFAGAPRASVQVIAPSRHFIMYDQPAQLDAALQAFLQRLP